MNLSFYFFIKVDLGLLLTFRMDMTRTKKHVEDLYSMLYSACCMYFMYIIIRFIDLVNICEYGYFQSLYCSKTKNIISPKLLYVLVNISEIAFHEFFCQGQVIHKVNFKVKS